MPPEYVTQCIRKEVVLALRKYEKKQKLKPSISNTIPKLLNLTKNGFQGRSRMRGFVLCSSSRLSPVLGRRNARLLYHGSMNPLEEKKTRQKVLLGIFEEAGGEASRDVITETLAVKLGLDFEEFSKICRVLKSEGFIDWMSFDRVHLTGAGRAEGEKLMTESYFQEKRRVLKMIADISRMSQFVVFEDLAKRLGMTNNELAPLCNGLDEDGSIDFPGGDIITIKDAGYRALQPQEPQTTGQHIHIHQPQNSPMSFGLNSTQTVTYNNQPVQDILPALAELISEVKALDFTTRGDVIEELEKVQSLAKGEMNAGIWQLIQSRLLTTKTALEIATLAAPSLPYWPTVWNYFFK